MSFGIGFGLDDCIPPGVLGFDGGDAESPPVTAVVSGNTFDVPTSVDESIIVLGGVAFFFASITTICFAELLLSILMNLLALIASGTVDAGHRNKYVVVCYALACMPARS
jgi:hypothetical protein